MSSTTTTTPAATRKAGIADYQAALTALEAARAKGDKAAVLKASGKLGTPVQRIRDAELEMALAGQEFTPWEKPKTARPSKLVDIGTQAEVQAKIDGYKKLAQDESRPTVAKSAKVAIEGLAKAAAKRGMKVNS